MRSVFIGTGAFLGRILSESRLAFWADEPTEHDFDPALLIEIALALTPNAAVTGSISWDAIEVDDCFTGPTGNLSGSTIGPRWPELQIAGVISIEQSFVARLPEKLRPACPPAHSGGRDYEHHSVLYWPHVDDPRAGKRYTGHHAVIVEERGTLARVDVYPPGLSDSPTTLPLVMWIDLASHEQCDAGRDSLTKIGAGDAPKQGALFLIAGSIER
jgi:hypothetical protein